jgi:hypothetical protein
VGLEASEEQVPQPATAAPSTLLDELRLVRRAWSALRDHQGDAALAALDEHAARFPDGELAPERLAARAVALCEIGRADEGARAAAAFLAAHPRSPHASRVRGACH